MFKYPFRTIALLALGSILLFLNVRPVTHAAANLVADYRFNGSHSSSVGSAPAVVDLGTNGFASETVDATTCNVLTFASGNGLSLATNGVISSDTYSLVILFRFENTSGYRKIADFKNGTSDGGLYNLSTNLRFYPVISGTNGAIQDNTYVQVVLTRNGTNKQTTGYVNGTQEFQFDDTNDYGVIDASNTLRFLLDDEQTTSEESSGAVARIRLYDDVLSADEVAALDRTHGDCGGSSIITIQNTDTAIEYYGWQGIADGGASGGSYRQSKIANGKATLKFNGTSAKYFYRAAPNMGKVDVYLDKVKVKSLCQYAATPTNKSKAFKNLANSKHTLEIRVLNQTCNGSSDSYGSVDKVVVGATTNEDSSMKWNWNGWKGKGAAAADGGNYHFSKTPGAFAKLTFTGTSIEVLTLKGPTFGWMDVVIDGNTIESLNLLNGTVVAFTKSYSGLADTEHTIELRRNANSGSNSIVVDGLRGPILLP